MDKTENFFQAIAKLEFLLKITKINIVISLITALISFLFYEEFLIVFSILFTLLLVIVIVIIIAIINTKVKKSSKILGKIEPDAEHAINFSFEEFMNSQSLTNSYNIENHGLSSGILMAALAKDLRNFIKFIKEKHNIKTQSFNGFKIITCSIFALVYLFVAIYHIQSIHQRNEILKKFDSRDKDYSKVLTLCQPIDKAFKSSNFNNLKLSRKYISHPTLNEIKDSGLYQLTYSYEIEPTDYVKDNSIGLTLTFKKNKDDKFELKSYDYEYRSHGNSNFDQISHINSNLEFFNQTQTILKNNFNPNNNPCLSEKINNQLIDYKNRLSKIDFKNQPSSQKFNKLSNTDTNNPLKFNIYERTIGSKNDNKFILRTELSCSNN